MNWRPSNLFRIFFAFSDLFMLNVINLILLRVFHQATISINYEYTVLCITNNMLWLMCAYITAIYTGSNIFDYKRLFQRTLYSFFAYLVVNFVFILIYPSSYYHQFIYYSLTGFALFLFFSRISFQYLSTLLYNTRRYQKKIVIVGHNNSSFDLIKFFRAHKRPVSIAGFFDEDIDKKNEFDIPVLGTVSSCLAYATSNRVTEIYCTLDPQKHVYLYQIAEDAEKSFIRFKFIPDFSEFQTQSFHIDFQEGFPIISIRNEPLEYMPNRIKKRVFDIIFSSLVIVFILSWLIPILGILILFDSNGPIFFRQMRSGKNNEPFLCLKLRTLHISKTADLVQVTRNDSRITKLGGFLRKSSLDELPQFFNVLAGNMSIVGSRPHMIKHTEEYSKQEDKYMVRHFLKPGITGWAQINGYRGEISNNDQLKKRVEHDIWYLENWNPWLDLKIVFLTFYSALKGDKNAF